MKINYNEQVLQNIFRINVTKILKSMRMTRLEFARKIGFNEKTFTNKMAIDRKFNLCELLWIADELGEYLEDLCRDDFEIKSVDK